MTRSLHTAVQTTGEHNAHTLCLAQSSGDDTLEVLRVMMRAQVFNKANKA